MFCWSIRHKPGGPACGLVSSLWAMDNRDVSARRLKESVEGHCGIPLLVSVASPDVNRARFSLAFVLQTVVRQSDIPCLAEPRLLLSEFWDERFG